METYLAFLREYEECPQLFEDISCEAEAVAEAAAFAGVVPVFEDAMV
jgi:hypothetical protein